jgi:hypothetical protein
MTSFFREAPRRASGKILDVHQRPHHAVDRLRARGTTASHSLSAPHSSTSKWRAVFQQRGRIDQAGERLADF